MQRERHREGQRRASRLDQRHARHGPRHAGPNAADASDEHRGPRSRRRRRGGEGEDGGQARDPGGGERRPQPGEQGGPEGHAEEGAGGLERREQPDAARNAPQIAPLEAGAERGPEPAERERRERREAAQRGLVEQLDARPERHTHRHQGPARREQHLQPRRAPPRAARQAGREQTDGGEPRESRENGTHGHARTFANA